MYVWIKICQNFYLTYQGCLRIIWIQPRWLKFPQLQMTGIQSAYHRFERSQGKECLVENKEK